MRAHEFLIETNLFELSSTEQFKHGKYLLVHTKEPAKNNEYMAVIYDSEKKKIGELRNQDLEALKREFIKIANSHQQDELKQNLERREKVSANDVKKSALDFNTAFTRIALENEVPTAVRLFEKGGKLYLDVMTREYYESGGAEEDKTFRQLSDRNWNERSKTKVYGLNVTPKKLEQMGFDFHGVYGLTDENSPEPKEYKRYSLDLVGYSDKQKSYPFPAITVAFWYKSDRKPGDENIDDEDI